MNDLFPGWYFQFDRIGKLSTNRSLSTAFGFTLGRPFEIEVLLAPRIPEETILIKEEEEELLDFPLPVKLTESSRSSNAPNRKLLDISIYAAGVLHFIHRKKYDFRARYVRVCFVLFGTYHIFFYRTTDNYNTAPPVAK